MKPSRISCLGFILVAVLAVMMVGVIGMTAGLSATRSYYTADEEQWLTENRQRQMVQAAPTINAYKYEGSTSGIVDFYDSDKPIAAPPIATGARESRVTADLKVSYKQQGGATVTAYDLQFNAAYLINNPAAQQVILDLVFPFPQNAAVLSEVNFEVDGVEPADVSYSMQYIRWRAVLEPGKDYKIEIHYRAEGVGSFGYGLPSAQRIRDFDLQVTIQGASEINIPESALGPTEQKDEDGKKSLTWRYNDVITNRSVQIELPARPSLAFAQKVEKLGDFFINLALAAPLMTVFFLLCLWVIARLESLRVAAENHVLLGIGFFLFYPLFIFSAGFLELPLAYIIALVVAGAMVLAYGVRVFSKRLAAIYLVPLLVVFFGLMTRALTVERFVDFGLMLVVSGVVLVALFMWRIGQARKLMATSPEPPAGPAPVVGQAPSTPATPVQEAAKPAPAQAPRPPSPERYCAHCGKRVEPGFKFCPHCGEDAQVLHKCAACGLEYIPAEGMPAYCPACGKKQS